jgi:uncharacterized metal-binding protein YceD (DUF177 family)
MSTQDREMESDASRSRFSYFGDEPTEGGVQSVLPAGTRGDSLSRAKIAGAPGPDERLLDISELARTVGMHYTHAFAFPPTVEGDLETVSPATGTVKLTNAGAALLLTGDAKAILRMECARCLKPVDQPVEAELDEHFDLLTRNNAFNQEEVQAVDEDSPAAVITGNVLNLADLLRQNLLLAAPLQPLCREDCPGIPYSPDDDDAAALDAKAAESANPLKRLAELLEAKRLREGATE